MDNQVFTVFCVNLLWAAFSYALLYVSESTLKRTVVRDIKQKCSNGDSELQNFVLLGVALLAYYFVLNSLPINPLKTLCNKELALCLPQITASWEQKPVSKIYGFFERTKQNHNGLLPS